MKVLLVSALLLCLPLVGLAQTKQRKAFSYDYTIDDLPNGLRLVTVPTDYPNLVAFYAVVRAGSRNEVEPGKSGFAHFFEHMMFRGSQNYTSDQRDAILKRAGAEANAYTTDDRTVYHEIFSKDDLDEVMKLEADRFTRLKYSPEDYKTEAKAVKGEFDKNSANPISKLYEVLRETAFKKHTYAHTTMGYLKDIEDMPNQYDYSLEFYKRFYRPEYTTIVLVGDVTRERALALTKQYWGDWKRGDYSSEISAEPQQTEPRTAHIDWPSPTLPYVAIAFRGPAYSDEKKDKAALDLLASIAFGENSALYQKLVLKEQKVDLLGPDFGDQIDPELFTVFARVKDPKDVDYVRDQILATFKSFTTVAIPQDKLDATRSRQRYGTLMAMNSSAAIARALAPYIALRRTPETINKLFDLYDSVTSQDIRAAAAEYFKDQNRTVVTLATKMNPTAQTSNKEGGN
ncbi:MAG TPA: pitrilysin family protein [Pyrinomonadaceae bacterium]|nr:pitrilysin family protein [Pyrinomonadaceae bacterium]